MGSDDKRWWDIISVGCPHDVEPEDWCDTLQEVLAELPPDDIVRFDHWMDRQTDRAYHRDLWRTAYLINGGASDDGFYYFRLWLVGMGKTVFEAALENPDSLADVVEPDKEYEAEMYGTACLAWCEVMGKDPYAEPDEYSIAHDALGEREFPELRGEEWPSRDTAEYRRRFPRLSAIYLTDEDKDDEDA